MAAAIPMTVDGMLPWNDSYSQSPSYTSSSDGYPSPIPGANDFANGNGTLFPPMPFFPDLNNTRASSVASFADPSWPYVSHSPVSPSCPSMTYPWGPNEKTSNASGLAYMSALYPTTSMPMTGYDHFDAKTLMQGEDEQGNVVLFGEQTYGMDPFVHAPS